MPAPRKKCPSRSPSARAAGDRVRGSGRPGRRGSCRTRAGRRPRAAAAAPARHPAGLQRPAVRDGGRLGRVEDPASGPPRTPSAGRCCRPSRTPAARARMNVGRNARRSSGSRRTSAVCPSLERCSTEPISITRPNTCASGRNSSVEPWRRTPAPAPCIACLTSAEQVAVGEHAALGAAGGAGGVDDRGQVVGPHRASGAARPRRRRSRRRPRPARPPRRSNSRPGRAADRTEASTSSRCASVSTNAATAPESARIQSTCSALEVSYTGTRPRRPTRSRSPGRSTRTGWWTSARPGRRCPRRPRSGPGRRRSPRPRTPPRSRPPTRRRAAGGRRRPGPAPPARCRRPCRSTARRRPR